MTTIYGIKNCDTMKKARTWLDEHGVSHEFHDYKAKGIDAVEAKMPMSIDAKAMITGETEGMIKLVADKNPATYARIFERHTDGPERTVMVGNSLRSDIEPVLGLGGWGRG